MGFAKLPSTIYAIRNKMNGRVYVGRTSDFNLRIKQHFSKLRSSEPQTMKCGDKRVETLFQIDFDTFGEDAFEVYILEEDVEPKECQAREAYWIGYYNSTNPIYGYNIRSERRPSLEFTVIHGIPPRSGGITPDEPGGIESIKSQ